MSIREISRRTGLARNTVKKYLRSDENEPTYAKRARPSKLDPYAEKLATWLGVEATKSRKQRRNLRQIYTSQPTTAQSHIVNNGLVIELLRSFGPRPAVWVAHIGLTALVPTASWTCSCGAERPSSAAIVACMPSNFAAR